MEEAIESGRIGIGQLFRHLNALPKFKILSAEKREDGVLCREYILSCDQLSCHFIEEFVNEVWNLSPHTEAR